MKIRVGEDFGNYQIVRHIGGGGMAQIYLAKTKGLAGFEKFLALKVINAEYANEERFVRMLVNEAKIAVGLSHVNVAQILDLGEFSGIYYIAMEYVDGVDVLELVNRLHSLSEKVPVNAVAYIGRQICSGLHYAHTRKNKSGQPLNIVHRDISPQNILVSRAGEVKVVDFGIAKAVGVTTKTQAGVIKGKVNYMAPEQVLGQVADARADIFAVGIVLWEMLTSQMAYSGDDMGELATKVRKAQIPPPSRMRRDMPPELDKIVVKALARETRDRYQSAHDLQVALMKFLSANAPEYSGSHLAQLIERITGEQHEVEDADGIDDLLSHDDRLADRHSLIFEPGGLPQLLLQGDGEGTVYTLGDKAILGRAGDVAITDARVSRQHACVSRLGTRFAIEDMGSANGTFVNGERIQSARALYPGDMIRIGNSQLLFRIADGNAEADSLAPPSRVPSRLILHGSGTPTECALDAYTELRYRLTLGPMVLTGCCGKVLRRDDGYYLEPAKGAARVNGKAASSTVRLEVGDEVNVAGIHFTIAG